MTWQARNGKLLFFLGLAGLIIAVSAGLSETPGWFQSLCGGLGDGCRETARYALLGLPLWAWGAGFYALFAATAWLAPGFIFWLMAAGLGVEISLVGIMVSAKAPCVFCIGNFVVLAAIVLAAMPKSRFWQTLAVSLLVYLASHAIITEDRNLYAASTTDRPGQSLPEPQIGPKPGDLPEFVLGPANASVTIVEYSDFQCPACRGVHPTIHQIRDMYQGRLKWVFRDFPLSMHEFAKPAANAARCAADQNKYWDYQDLLYASTKDMTTDVLEDYAKQLGLDQEAFKQCVESNAHMAAVEKSAEAARDAGIDRTPTFIINGDHFKGVPTMDKLKEAIDKQLKSSN
jgi:protein-disulfide isomerase